MYLHLTMTSTSERMLGDKNLKRKLIKSVESVKNKVKALRSDKASLSSALETTFQPITKPLNVLANNAITETKTTAPTVTADDKISLKNFVLKKRKKLKGKRKSAQFESSFKEFSDGAAADDYYNSDDSSTTMKSALSSDEDSSSLQQPPLPTPPPPILMDYIQHVYEQKKIPFGVYLNTRGLYMGDSPIHFFENKLSVKDAFFPLTKGLMELIFKKEPIKSLLTTEDVDNYLKILTMTHAYRRGFQEEGQVQAHSNVKYRTFIKKYLLENKIIKGGCLLSGNATVKGTKNNKRDITMKRFYPNTDYIYWDNPNELVNRLRLLFASQSAGNTSHTNEINSIIEELKEAGIIK